MPLSEDFVRVVEELYGELFDRLIVYAQNILNNYELAEEIVQNAFLIACLKPKEFMDSPNQRGWLVKTVKNNVWNLLRAQARTRQRELGLDDEGRAGYEVPCEDDYVDLMYSDLFSPEEFALLKRVVIQRYTIAEAAKELGISAEACSKRVQRAKRRVRKILEEMK